MLDISSVALHFKCHSKTQIAAEHLSHAKQTLSTYRDRFADVKAEAYAVCQKWGVSTSFEQKRASKVKRHFDELSRDRPQQINQKINFASMSSTE